MPTISNIKDFHHSLVAVEKKIGRVPTIQDAAFHLGISVSTAWRYFSLMAAAGLIQKNSVTGRTESLKKR